MAEKIVSPGVFTNEIDQSFLPAGVAAIGAAVIGPTAKGPAMIPTVVSSYQEFAQIFGGKFSSGSGAVENSYKFLTNYAAQEYLKYADTLTVVRVLAGAYSSAKSVVSSSSSTGATFASQSFNIQHNPTGSLIGGADEITIGGVDFTFVSESAGLTNTATQIFVEFGQSTATDVLNKEATATNLKNAINNNTTLHNLKLTATTEGMRVIVSGSEAGIVANLTVTTGSGGDAIATTPDFVLATGSLNIQGGTNSDSQAVSFILHTLSDGADQNSAGTYGVNNLLANGTDNNIQWEIQSVNNNKGTFTLLVRRGNDTIKRKNVLEQFNNLTLDPNTPNYIGKVLGDQQMVLRGSGTTDPYLQLSGSFANRSRYVRVEVHQNTYNYLDENGNIRDASLTAFLPTAGSGSFSEGSNGTEVHPKQFYDKISNTNVQGFNLDSSLTNQGYTEYVDAINLLGNQDEYDINLLTLPGLVDNFTNHASVLQKALEMVENRGDCFAIIDPVEYASAITTATAKAEARDSNYAAMYWPWVEIPDAELGRNVWVPAGTVIPSVYAFNDRVAAPWFAPAGLNRGGIDIATRTERKLTHSNRDTLYESNVNPIATFPNSGVTVFGQKTLQKKSSALDRVNVRRLLIAAKKFIASTSKFLIFENNTAATRNRFLSIVNPYFENVQQRQGLYAFKVVMDETNNTPDVIDRNQMKGQIFLQPAKTAEFIIIDFNVLPTGAAFPE
jgi:phage tail sheath protein FI